MTKLERELFKELKKLLRSHGRLREYRRYLRAVVDPDFEVSNLDLFTWVKYVSRSRCLSVDEMFLLYYCPPSAKALFYPIKREWVRIAQKIINRQHDN